MGHPTARGDANAGMTTGLVAVPVCTTCGAPAARVELIAPGQLPASWEHWSEQQRESFRRYRDRARWWLLYEGIAAGNGGGDAISAERAAHLVAAFSRPYSYGRVHEAGLYDDAGFCQVCGVAYCCQHWRVSRSGYGHCPAGHGKSLDPHWYPE